MLHASSTLSPLQERDYPTPLLPLPPQRLNSRYAQTSRTSLKLCQYLCVGALSIGLSGAGDVYATIPASSNILFNRYIWNPSLTTSALFHPLDCMSATEARMLSRVVTLPCSVMMWFALT